VIFITYVQIQCKLNLSDLFCKIDILTIFRLLTHRNFRHTMYAYL